MAMFGLSCVRTELVHLLIIPSLAHHPKQANRQLPGHGDFGDLSSPSHRQVKVLVPCGILRAATWADSTNKKRSIELPCLVICPSRRRSPLESSRGTNP